MRCEFFKCENAARGGKLCPTHYQQKRKGHGAAEIDLTEHSPCKVSHCTIPATTREGAYCSPHYQMQYRGVDPETRIARIGGKSSATCWVEECHRMVTSKGLCNSHARNARAGRLEVPDSLGVILNPECSFDGCDRPYITKKLCHTHYTQLNSGRGLSEIRDWRKYHKGEHICEIPQCRKAAVSTGLCESHKSRQTQYKITPNQMIDIWTSPKCSNPGCDETKRLHMDHNHSTGKFRALLCNGCNSGLGMLKENPNRIAGLIEYLRLYPQ